MFRNDQTHYNPHRSPTRTSRPYNQLPPNRTSRIERLIDLENSPRIRRERCMANFCSSTIPITLSIWLFAIRQGYIPDLDHSFEGLGSTSVRGEVRGAMG